MIKINLTEHGDRVVSLAVTDKHGEVYKVNLEFVAHDFDTDDVQVSVKKMPMDWEQRMEKDHSCPVYSANQILYNERPVMTKKQSGHALDSVWYEFHDVGNLPAVRSPEPAQQVPTPDTMF
jgi:hypothetical protein